VNVGTVAAGDWPSSGPARARLGVRVGFPRRWTPDEAFDRVRSAVLGVPAVAYGPRSRNIHGTDEAVELASIVSGARTMARFIAGFFMSGGLR
jgi:acetylornithine deacetylase/succinyl-diaminopimelate desuccinylase-like protein